jgi:hypothetical protein
MKEVPAREPGQIVTPAYLLGGALRYGAEGGDIVGRNGSHFNNRPLYGPANEGGAVLAGDRPFVRLIAHPFLYGAFAAGIVRCGAGRWFHEYASVEARYRCGRMTWRLEDPGLPGVSAELAVAPLAKGAGFAARFSAGGLRAGDRLVWMFGGARAGDNPRTAWDPVNRGNPQVDKGGSGLKAELKAGWVPEWSGGNAVHREGGGFRVAASADATASAAGRSDRGGVGTVGDAAAAAGPASFAASTDAGLPAVCEVVGLGEGTDAVFWAFAAGPGNPVPPDPQRAFADAIAYLESIERMRAETPDARLDAAVAAVCHPVDGNCERDPFIFRHGCMSWSMRFLGWRVIHGATALGWHERVRGNAAHYAAAQVREAGTRTAPRADPVMRLCTEGPESRLHGRGRIPPDQHFYNTQTQFFDQTVRDWRWTADPALEAILRPALELHLEWSRECFDPDDDGLYESYINTLPTDSVWYNGGGSVEESAYAYYGHRAAADMARRAGDGAGQARHDARAQKIRRALLDVLWLRERGHFGLYVEQGGHGRVHADAWVYSQFLPVDAGLTEPDEALQALYYTEWALERIRLPFGGVICQPSNWVPSKWSVRDMFSGDLCHLALAYFKTGLGDDGWDLLNGSTLETCYAGAVPGGFSQVGAGTDFADGAHMFARVVAEGLFGFDPDYPNGVVRIRPAFPAAWPRASLRTPDFTLEYRREEATECYALTLARPAGVEFRVPVRARTLRRVQIGGRPSDWRAEPGYGCTWIHVRIPAVDGNPMWLELRLELEDPIPDAPAVHLEANVGETVLLECGAGEEGARAFRDFHTVLEDPRFSADGLRGRAARKPGHHIVLAEAGAGGLPRWRVFKLRLSDPAAEAADALRTPRRAPEGAAWTCLDLGAHLNGDVRGIFRQQYLSPRPNTCSVRLGVDGYSAWTFPHWREGPPEIDLDGLGRLASGAGRILTPQNVPFAGISPGRNIAFTSLWDNWPGSVTVPVHRSADAAWLLVCGSTFPMQTRIANAEIRFAYADGVVERLELVPPRNFWSLCSWGGLDYSYETDAFCLPPVPPPSVQLGSQCRAMVLSWTLRPGVELRDVTLETLSQDVVIGLMGVSLMRAPSGIRTGAGAGPLPR